MQDGSWVRAACNVRLFSSEINYTQKYFLANFENKSNQIAKLPWAELFKYILLFADRTLRPLCLQYCNDILNLYMEGY